MIYFNAMFLYVFNNICIAIAMQSDAVARIIGMMALLFWVFGIGKTF